MLLTCTQAPLAKSNAILSSPLVCRGLPVRLPAVVVVADTVDDSEAAGPFARRPQLAPQLVIQFLQPLDRELLPLVLQHV